jgi:hypothetical protein
LVSVSECGTKNHPDKYCTVLYSSLMMIIMGVMMMMVVVMMVGC